MYCKYVIKISFNYFMFSLSTEQNLVCIIFLTLRRNVNLIVDFLGGFATLRFSVKKNIKKMLSGI